MHSAGAAGQLKPGIRGKKPGCGRCLSPAQERAVRQTICDKRPEQLKMEFALWSRPAVRQYIKLSLGIKLSIRVVGNYLARWGDETALVNTDAIFSASVTKLLCMCGCMLQPTT